MANSKSVPRSACPVDKRLRCHALHGPTRERGDARLGTRLSRTDNSWHPRTRGNALLESSSTSAISSDEVADARLHRRFDSCVAQRMALPSLLLAPQASRLWARPDESNCAQPRLPSLLPAPQATRLRSRPDEWNCAQPRPPSLLFAPQASRPRAKP